MIRINMTLEQERWLTSSVKPPPSVIVLAYAGAYGSMEWKPVFLYTADEFAKLTDEDIDRLVTERYPSTRLIRVMREG